MRTMFLKSNERSEVKK